MPFLIATFCFYISITIYVFGFVVPLNEAMLKLKLKLEKEPEDEKAAKEFADVQSKWRRWNLGLCLARF